MKASRFVAVAASAMLALSTVTTNAGMTVINTPQQHFNATPFWIIFGCAGSVVLAALAKNASQHQPLTQQEAMTCGLAYWFNPQNYRP
jgi:hypothetical protein